MKRILALAAFLALLAPAAALGQGTPTANVVSSCGSASYPAGTARPQTQDTTGRSCGSGSGGSTAISAPIYLTPTNDSISLTLGGTAQNIMASNATRKGCTIQNPATATDQGIATAENIYVNFGGTAAAASTSFELVPGQSISCSPLGIGTVTSAVSVVGATTNHKIIGVEYN